MYTFKRWIKICFDFFLCVIDEAVNKWTREKMSEVNEKMRLCAGVNKNGFWVILFETYFKNFRSNHTNNSLIFSAIDCIFLKTISKAKVKRKFKKRNGDCNPNHIGTVRTTENGKKWFLLYIPKWWNQNIRQSIFRYCWNFCLEPNRKMLSKWFQQIGD